MILVYNISNQLKKRNNIMKFFISLLIIVLMSGCTYYQTAPNATPGMSKFDQSWNAANGAFTDQGVQLINQNRAAGVLQGNYNGANVTITLITQANGSVRVEFDTAGTSARSRSDIERIASSYNRRMGR